jgi:hypothetical protein
VYNGLTPGLGPLLLLVGADASGFGLSTSLRGNRSVWVEGSHPFVHANRRWQVYNRLTGRKDSGITEVPVKKHPGIIRYTLDSALDLNVLEDGEDGGDSLVVEGFTAEHALQDALVELKFVKRDLEIASKAVPAFDRTQAIRALRGLAVMDIRSAKHVVDFVMHHGGITQDSNEEELSKAAYNVLGGRDIGCDWKYEPPHPMTCICDTCTSPSAQ